MPVFLARMLARVAPDTFGPVLVRVLVKRAGRLRWFRDRGSRRRLVFATEAVGLARRLAMRSGGRHDGLLARALVVYARLLSDVWKHEEALEACAEAEELAARHGAVATDPVGPGGELLARASASHGLGRHEDGLAAAEAAKAAVAFYRRQIDDGNPRAAPLLVRSGSGAGGDRGGLAAGDRRTLSIRRPRHIRGRVEEETGG